MDTTKTEYPDEQIAALTLKSTPKEIQAIAAKLSVKQLGNVISALVTEDAADCSKLIALISGLSDHAQLEMVGQTLTHRQMLSLLDTYTSTETCDIEKLSSIFIGMPKEVFAFTLRQASPSQTRILQQLGKTEPLQHHLNLLSSSLAANISEFSVEFGTLNEIIKMMDIEELGLDDYIHLIKRIEILKVAFALVLDLTDSAIALAWKTDRSDLIEKFNTIRSNCQHFLIDVGHPANANLASSGLYEKLKDRLMSIYGNPNDPRDVEALQNSDPASEGLAKFSVWYVEDYFDIGLLPEIKNRKNLDLDSQTHSEQERAAYHASLLEQARNYLEKLGIKTVHDLKERGIFSKKTLHEFIMRSKSESSQ